MSKNNNSKLNLRILTIILMLQPITSCAFDTFDIYKDSIKEDLQDPKTRRIEGKESNLHDLNGCQFLLELRKWNKFDGRWQGWDRENVWKDGTINHYKRFGLDFKDDLSNKILPNPKIYPIYIGPWQHSTRINKNIRFFAYYPKEGGNIQYQYESQTEENKNIPEKKFSLSPTAKFAPDRFSLCVVKWTARFGYNAIAEVEYPGFFNKIFRSSPVPTGKIIEVKE